LSFQQLMAASAAARFSMASSRAASTRPTLRAGSLTTVRATAFQVATGLLCQKIAMCVCSGVRTALSMPPSALTSLKSAAHAALDSAFGPAVRNCDELRTSAEQLTLPSVACAVTDVVFSQDGTKLASASACDGLRVWALDVEDLLQIAEQNVTRSLTEQECRQYLHTDQCPQS
jgi:hypothetical protein